MVGESGNALLPEFSGELEFGETNMAGCVDSPDDIFGILEALEGMSEFGSPPMTPLEESGPTLSSCSKDGKEVLANNRTLVSQESVTSSCARQSESETEAAAAAASSSCKRQKLGVGAAETAAFSDGHRKMSHITVERNRRKQMNGHLSVLRSLMPCFYVKRGDQASIIGGVVDYISELQQVLQSLEAKKQRKVYSDIVLSPRMVSSPRVPPSPLSSIKPPISPRPSLPPLSPRTPQPSSPYKSRLHGLSPTMASSVLEPLPSPSSTSSTIDSANELVANSKSALADVEVKFSGPNLLLKAVSPRIPGQAAKIISALEELSLEILSVNISTNDETMINSFTIKIGIECQLSAEELAHQIQQTFHC